ncbi:hypothetical protein, partial [Streptomyces sp. NPDC058620]|uniref:hypothetical protein n=1 Tax=Streptomyces sp. NPDC058620 TaxID=3346560 RepID=UPI00364BB29E
LRRPSAIAADLSEHAEHVDEDRDPIIQGVEDVLASVPGYLGGGQATYTRTVGTRRCTKPPRSSSPT